LERIGLSKEIDLRQASAFLIDPAKPRFFAAFILNVVTINNPKPSISTQISWKGASKNQIVFNTLVDDIRKASFELEHLKEELPKASAEYRNLVRPYYKEIHLIRKRFILAIERFLNDIKLSKYQTRIVEEFLLLQIRLIPDPDPETREIFNRYSDDTFEQYTFKQEKKSANSSNPESDPFKENLENDFTSETCEENEAEEEWEFQKKACINKAKLKKEADQQNQLKRSLKTIYTSLMKIFHPDTETNPELKAGKEEISKKITVAYGNQDFFGLLKLEAEFLSQNKDRIKGMPDDQIALYLKILSNQKSDLLKEIAMLKMEFGPIYSSVTSKKNGALKSFLKGEKSALEQAILQYSIRIRSLSTLESSDWKSLIETMEEELELAENM